MWPAPHKIPDCALIRFDIDDSGTISDETELRQLSVNLCMRLQLVMKVDAIQQAHLLFVAIP